MVKVVTKEWTKVKNSEIEFFLVLAAEIIQVLDSIAWVRCASGLWQCFVRFVGLGQRRQFVQFQRGPVLRFYKSKQNRNSD